MKQIMPRPIRSLVSDRLVTLLFVPVFACVLFSMLFMLVNASAWAAQADDGLDVPLFALEKEGSADDLSRSSDSGATDSSDEAAQDIVRGDDVLMMDEDCSACARGVLDAQIATDGCESVLLEMRALEAKLVERKESFRLAVQGFEAWFGDNASRASSKQAISEDIDSLENRMVEAFDLMQTVRREMLIVQGPKAIELFGCVSSLYEAAERQDMLERLAYAQCALVERLARQKKLLLADAVMDAVVDVLDEEELENTVQEVGNSALCLEALCSRMRQAMKDLQALVSLQDSEEGVEGVPYALNGDVVRASQTVSECERLLADWYGRLANHCEGGEAISFGTELEFSLSEEAFVRKWGNAIDAFFAAYGEGIELPLQGFGNAIARSAYLHKVDPRLCAAVSIVESGGGRACVRPFNAWGWGAVDEDPYRLAAEWSSFDEAIEAWHRGMATSTTGLASAPTLSLLACAYCSSPRWGAEVAQLMQRIGAYATM